MPSTSDSTLSPSVRSREAAGVSRHNAKRLSSSRRSNSRHRAEEAAAEREKAKHVKTAASSPSSETDDEPADTAAAAAAAERAVLIEKNVSLSGKHRRSSRSSNSSRRERRRRSRSSGSETGSGRSRGNRDSSRRSERSSSGESSSSSSGEDSDRSRSSSDEEPAVRSDDAAAERTQKECSSRKPHSVKREKEASGAAAGAEAAESAATQGSSCVKAELEASTSGSHAAAAACLSSRSSDGPSDGDTGSSSSSRLPHNSANSNSDSSSREQPGDEKVAATELPEAQQKQEESSSSEDDAFGPLPVAAKKMKIGSQAQQELRRSKKAAAAAAQQRRLEELHLQNLPTADRYYKSFMHRDEISHVVVSPLRGFILTGSVDGHVKFWIRTADDIEFVKHFRAHVGALHCLCISASDGGSLVGSVGGDNTFRLFEVLSFDMLCLLKLSFSPACCEFVHARDCPSPIVAISSCSSPEISLFQPTLQATPFAKYGLHLAPVHVMKYSEALHACVSADGEGGLELWCTDTCRRLTCETTSRVSFSLKSETDFYELAKNKTHAIALAVSPDAQLLAVLADDAHLRIFRLTTGKLSKVYLDTVEMHQTAQHDPRQAILHADALDFEFRVAAEKELNKSRAKAWQTLCFDDSSTFLIYPSLLGIKVVSVRSNKLCRIIGRPEHGLRFLAVALYQAQAQRNKPLFFGEVKGGGSQKDKRLDAVIVASAFKKHRVYFFTPEAPADAIVDVRDVFNEKPSKEEQETLAPAAASPLSPGMRVGKTATIFTTAGDIFIRLFPQECPKTVENFCTHARNGYYDRCIFHRVIKGFMIQTGDPNGDGTGGESIWGGDFEDEFHRALKHDRPFTVSMANAGPNTNGSQFFITTVPCSWLDNKHTVFGRVVQGMDVVSQIENVPTTVEDKPKQDIKILTIKVTS